MPLMPLIKVLIPLMIALIGALKIFAIPETIPEKMLTIPCHAPLQFPANTLVIKSDKALKNLSYRLHDRGYSLNSGTEYARKNSGYKSKGRARSSKT